MKESLLSRDLLYPTENLYEPGSVHIEVLSPDKKDRIPIIIEEKSAHSPIKYIDSIIRIMQADVFDRILVDLKKNASIYIKTNNELKKEYGGSKYLLVTANGGKIEFRGMNDIEV